jgi:small subunit ribosomal protein S4
MIEILEALKRVSTDGVPAWLEVNPDEVKGVVKQLPRRSDIKHPGEINEQIVVELYSK